MRLVAQRQCMPFLFLRTYELAAIIKDNSATSKSSSKKEGKDTCQSILGYLAKYPKILFHGCHMLKKPIKIRRRNRIVLLCYAKGNIH